MTGRRNVPTRTLERELAERYGLVAAMDEVGRGCLAGPVSVGIVVSRLDARAPTGLRDSKLLPAARREGLVAPVRRWALAYAVGHASAAEIDDVGIMAALRLAGTRALTGVLGQGVVPGVVLLDGNHDWLSRPDDLFAGLLGTDDGLLGTDAGDGSSTLPVVPPVVTRIKADLSCTGVAAASILAKVERDGLMVAAHGDDPRFAWDENKGYASPSHIAALAEHGPSQLHRRSWNLPGTAREASAEGMMVT